MTTETLYWHEDAQRRWQVVDDPETLTGPQMFSAEPARGPYAASVGTVVRLEYDVWQALGGPVEIAVSIEGIR